MAGITSEQYSKCFNINTFSYRLWRNKFWKTFRGTQTLHNYILALQGIGIVLFSLSFYFRLNNNMTLTGLFGLWFVIYYAYLFLPGYSAYKEIIDSYTGFFSEDLNNIVLAATNKEIGLFFNQGDDAFVSQIMDADSIVKIEKLLLQNLLLIYGNGKEVYQSLKDNPSNREPVENQLTVMAVPLCFSKSADFEKLLTKKCEKVDFYIDYLQKNTIDKV